MADEKDTTTEALMAGATKAHEDEVTNGRERTIIIDDPLQPDVDATLKETTRKWIEENMLYAGHVQPPGPPLTGFVQSLDPWNPPETGFKVHWTVPSIYEPVVEHQRIITRTYTIHGNVEEVLKGLGDDLKKDVAYAHWDRCVREEAARQLEIPRNAAEYLNELGRALESLDDLIEDIEEELCEDGFSYAAQFGYINMDLQRMYENLRLAEEALDSANSQVDRRLPVLLRDGTRKHTLVSNPYPQHKDVDSQTP